MTWLKVVERKGQSILISSYFYNGLQTTYFKRSLDINTGLNKYFIRDYSNYYDQREVEEMKNELKQRLEQTNFDVLQHFFDVFYKKGKQLLEFSEQIKKLKEKELVENTYRLFLDFSNLCLEFGPAMYVPILVEEFVENEIKRIIKKYIKNKDLDYFELFTSSCKPTEGSRELLQLYKLSRDLNTTRIKTHVKKYQWLSYTKWTGTLWTEETIQERIQVLDPKKIDKKISELGGLYHNNKEKTEKIIKKYNINQTGAKKIWLAKELAYFRTYRIDVYTKCGYNVLNLFDVVSDKLGLNRHQLVYITYKEILNLLKNKNKADKETIEKRQKQPWQMKFDHSVITFRYDKFEPVEIQDKKISHLKGQCAYPGKIKGYVVIIRGPLEFYKMKKDAILVTSMTTPDFVPLMEKAKAIITDEGGITCHAAIVARELHTPCIIGTKYGTKILKEGDAVKLDAEKGIINIL